MEQVLKSFSGRNSFLKSSVFGFYDTLSYDLEKSKELRALISWVLISCVILSSRCGFANYFDILNFLFQIYIQEGVLTCETFFKDLALPGIQSSKNLRIHFLAFLADLF